MAPQTKPEQSTLARITPVKKRVIIPRDQSPAGLGRISIQPDIPGTPTRESAVWSVLLMLSQAFGRPIPADILYRLKKAYPGGIAANEIPSVVEQCFKCKAELTALPLRQLSGRKEPAILLCRNRVLRLYYRSADGKANLYIPEARRQEPFQKKSPGLSLYRGQAVAVTLPVNEREPGQATPSDRFNTLWLIKLILRYKAVFFQVLAAALLIQIFALVTPLFTMVIIDKVFSASGYSTLHVLIIGLFSISVFDYLISSSRQGLLSGVTHKVDFLLSTAFFRKLTRLPLSFFSSRQIGDSVSRVKELEVIRGFFTGSAFMLLIDFPFLLIFIGVMLMFSVRLTLTAVLFISIILALYGIFGPFIQERLKGKNRIQSDNNSFLIEIIGGMEAIKSMSLEKKAQQRWEGLLVHHARNSTRTERLTGHISQFAGFLTKSTTAVCLWLGALMVLDGDLTPGQLIAFNMMVGRVIAPTQRISQLLQQLNQLKISLQRVGEIMNAAPELHVQETSQLPKLNGGIRLENVSFRYGDETTEVLREIDLEIHPGEVICLVGATGSGKTTLLRLLQRLYLPSSGHIYIDGINVLGINPRWFREKIGVVSQENVLFNMSIIENIRLAHTASNAADTDRVAEVCRLVGADRWIGRLPKAYDTIVGERGCFLSGGQRQQIAIARSLLRDPKILLLDEATSALDNEAEAIVENNMRGIFADRTVIIVAHHLPPRNLIDRIITLKDGRLAGETTAENQPTIITEQSE